MPLLSRFFPTSRHNRASAHKHTHTPRTPISAVCEERGGVTEEEAGTMEEKEKSVDGERFGVKEETTCQAPGEGNTKETWMMRHSRPEKKRKRHLMNRT